MLEVSSKEARELVCHSCGFANMIGEKYCSECGAPLNLEVSAPAAPMVSLISPEDDLAEPLTPSSSEKMVNCRYCGSKNTAGSKYCFECGAPLISHTHPNRSVQKTQSAVRSRQNYRPQDEEENEGPAPLPPNTVLQGRYQITKRIGQGGMGAIYLADDLRFSQRVAVVKEMLDHFTDPEQRRLATHNFDREAEMLANLKHSGIPEVYDRFTEGNRHYLVMEYVNGADLEQRMMNQENRPFEEDETLDWAIQICEILHYMHRQNPAIVYRDMKPANLILNDEGRIYVVDFGIARHFNPTKKGTMIGTQGYAPPEQYRGQVEPRSDLYALAATMHHLLTGRDPQGEAPFTFPTVRELNPKVSIHTDKVIGRCLNMEAEGRFRDAAEMSEALRKIRQRQRQTGESTAGTMPIQSKGISTALMKLGFSHRFLTVEWLLRFNIVLLSAIVLLLMIILAKN